ncbi:hypothetical protein [Azospirillum sp. TSH64]|uniref:hypothetical protein n=1 Tax=Azospirillum sp. TSH64 TaxID=652740 RepID=UPI0011B27CAC|nr:hypothetical protein [Azospirillum sp. TSH64]
MVGDDYGVAAIRHLEDAEILADGERWGGAGHLIGFAAECAIKHRIRTIKPTLQRVEGHLPALIGIARTHLTGRRDVGMLNLLRTSGLMGGWKVHLRYADDTAVGRNDFTKWRDHAILLMAEANLQRRG